MGRCVNSSGGVGACIQVDDRGKALDQRNRAAIGLVGPQARSMERETNNHAELFGAYVAKLRMHPDTDGAVSFE